LHHTAVANDTVLAKIKQRSGKYNETNNMFLGNGDYNKCNLHSTTNNVEMENME
jgi:hypothetical protein